MSTDMFRCILLPVALLSSLLSCDEAKVCQTMLVSNALYNTDVNGYYDVTDEICFGRVVYEKVNDSGTRYYIYYGEPDNLFYGWNIGEDPCSDTSVVYNLNNNRRPDYTLRYWIERLGDSWYYNFDLRVMCTEGLTFGQLIGVIIASMLGAVMLIAGTALGVKQILQKKKDSNRTSPSGSTPTSGDNHRSPISAEDGATNFTFQNDDNIALNQMITGHVMAPPAYNEVVSVPGNGPARNDDVNGNGTKPPSYEEAIASLMTTAETEPKPETGRAGRLEEQLSENIYEELEEHQPGRAEDSL